MRYLVPLVMSAVVSCGLSAAAQTKPSTRQSIDPNHELVIRHGKIIDGAGNDWFYGDVLVRGDRIAGIGKVERRPGADEIDASELIVAPGFIDVHTHADNDVVTSPLAENFVLELSRDDFAVAGSPFQDGERICEA